MSGCGPSKSSKEWAKTWRDWKSNTLKKVAKYKVYTMGTGGGSPKNLSLTAVENALTDFLTPDASGLTNICEGGFEYEKSRSNNSKDQYHSSSSSPVQEEKILKERKFEGDSKQYYSFSSVQKDKEMKENLIPRYSPTLPYVEDESNIYKIVLSDSSDDMMLHSMSQTQRMQSLVMDKKQPKTKKRKILIPSVDDNMQNIYENKENLLDKDSQMTPLDSTKYKSKMTAKYSEDTKKSNVMMSAMTLLENKTSASENMKLQFLEIKREKLKLKKEELCIHKDIVQQLQNINITLSSLREELSVQYLTTDT